MKIRFVKIAIFIILSVIQISAQQSYDLSSGGQTTISGAQGGFVTGSSDVTQNLSVTINFGEISVANPNNIVKVVVPIAIRSSEPYQITALITGVGNLDPQAIQPSDVGFGANNMRVLGNKAKICNHSSHIFNSPFNNDPSTTFSINAQGRVAYQASLANLTLPNVILTGPELTKKNGKSRKDDDGWVFDAIFVITPQFFKSGTTSAVLTFTISPGPNVQC